MSKFYIKYVPPRRGLDMVEYLQDYLSSIKSTVVFQPAFYDSISTFGVLTGEGDELSRVLRAIEGRSGSARLSPEEFAGASVHAFHEYAGPEKWEHNKMYALNTFVVATNPGSGPNYATFKCTNDGTSGANEPTWPINMNATVGDNSIIWTRIDSSERYMPLEQRPNWVNWLAQMGIIVTEGDKLNCAKYYKTNLLKEIAKKKFYDDNDSIADLSKAVMALTVHYSEFSPEEKVVVDNQIAIIKQIYDKNTAINGLSELTSRLSSILVSYYAARVQVVEATTIEEINNIIYE